MQKHQYALSILSNLEFIAETSHLVQWFEILICSRNSTKSILPSCCRFCCLCVCVCVCFSFFILFLSVPSQIPPNTVVKSTSTSTIDVSWDEVEYSYVHGILISYRVNYTKDDGSTPTWKTIILDSSTFKITLSDLEYFTRYKVVVCARTSKGCGKEYSAISYTWGNGRYSSVYILLANKNIKAGSCLYPSPSLTFRSILPFNSYLYISYKLGPSLFQQF